MLYAQGAGPLTATSTAECFWKNSHRTNKLRRGAKTNDYGQHDRHKNTSEPAVACTGWFGIPARDYAALTEMGPVRASAGLSTKTRHALPGGKPVHRHKALGANRGSNTERAGSATAGQGIMGQGLPKSLDQLPPIHRAEAERQLGRVQSIVPHSGEAGKADMPAEQATTRPPKRLRQSTKPLLNKLEQEWFDILKASHWMDNLRAQARRYRLGNGIWYKPDMTGNDTRNGRETAYEVKGAHAFRGGFENLKVAAGLWPEVKWILVWKQNGEWQQQEVLP